jgi:hypothetical protein
VKNQCRAGNLTTPLKAVRAIGLEANVGAMGWETIKTINTWGEGSLSPAVITLLISGDDASLKGEPPCPRFELVTRAGACQVEDAPDASGFELFFDGLKGAVSVAGSRTLDLRRKPIAARLLTVLLGDPGARFDKARLFREVWHTELRVASQAAALYKAVGRLARLLDDDPRRFFRWDEGGCLVVAAERPALLRLPLRAG